MATKTDLDRTYMKMAYNASGLSKAVRRKVGAVLVVPEGGRFEGVNGMPEGMSNVCEEIVVKCEHDWRHDIRERKHFCVLCSEVVDEVTLAVTRKELPTESTELVTKPECLHAESNAILKIARSTQSSIGSTMYCTLSPCLECAKLIKQAGIVRVVYSEQYPYPGHSGAVRAKGLDFLAEAKIRVDNLPMSSHNVRDDELTQQDEGRNDSSNDNWTGWNNP